MSAAVDNTNRSRIISHPGATYGGLLFKDREDANKKLVIFDAVLKFYKRLGFKSLIYKQVLISIILLLTRVTHIYSEIMQNISDATLVVIFRHLCH